MITFISHIIIFQENERLRRALPFLYVNQNGLQNVKNEFLLEHLSALDEVKVLKALSQFGFPIKPSRESITMAIWLSRHLIAAHLITLTKKVDIVYTSLHSVEPTSNAPRSINTANFKLCSEFFLKKILGSELSIEERKTLLISAFALGSQQNTHFGGF